MSDTPFVPGLELSGLFYAEAVRPILDSALPGLVYSAALIGPGSEVLGFDTARSTDHHWGPRLQLFLSEADQHHYADQIVETLRHRLPHRIRGYSTHFIDAPGEPGILLLGSTDSGPVNHFVRVHSLRAFVQDYLSFDLDSGIDVTDWLTFPEQKLRSLTAGRIYHDGLGELAPLRERLHYYPHDVWLYLMAAGWGRIGQEEAFVGRCGEVGDDLGSRIIAARLVRDLMRLGFLIERVYAPYPKWFGPAFARLECAARLTPSFEGTLAAPSWQERETHLCAAYEIVADMHNRLAITQPLPATVSKFHGRPFRVIHGGRFAETLRATIRDETVKRIPVDHGAIDQFSDSTDLLENPRLRQRLKSLYE